MPYSSRSLGFQNNQHLHLLKDSYTCTLSCKSIHTVYFTPFANVFALYRILPACQGHLLVLASQVISFYPCISHFRLFPRLLRYLFGFVLFMYWQPSTQIHHTSKFHIGQIFFDKWTSSYENLTNFCSSTRANNTRHGNLSKKFCS